MEGFKAIENSHIRISERAKSHLTFALISSSNSSKLYFNTVNPFRREIYTNIIKRDKNANYTH